MVHLRVSCRGAPAQRLFPIATGISQTRIEHLHSPIPSGLKVPNKEQEARHENPNAHEDQQDYTNILFAKANVIHNVRILSNIDVNKLRFIAGILKPDRTIRKHPYNIRNRLLSPQHFRVCTFYSLPIS
jgi:hypothetical protein